MQRCKALPFISFAICALLNCVPAQATNSNGPLEAKSMAELAAAFENSANESERRDILSFLEAKANAGSTGAMLLIGEIYAAGKVIPPNAEKAIALYTTASEQGNQFANIRLGDLYAAGSIVPLDPVKALFYYEKAAVQNFPQGKLKAGNAYISGTGINADPVKGVTYIKDAADAGDQWAMIRLGDLYSRGGVVPVDSGQAILYYQRAVDVGNITALVRLGEMYRDGTAVTADASASKKFFQAAADAGDPLGKVRLGEAYVKGLGVAKDTQKGLQLIAEGGELGDPNALKSLGDYLSRGEYVEIAAGSAIDSYEASGKAGNAWAYVRLAEIYRDGVLVPRSFQRAEQYYAKAADLGLLRAVVARADSHVYGKYGKYSDKNLGLKLINEALAAGEPMAVGSLANYKVWGLGTKKDPVGAINLLTAAAEGGNFQAAKTLISFYREGRGVNLKKNLRKARGVLERYAPVFTPSDLLTERVLQASAEATDVAGYAQVSALVRNSPVSTQVDTLTSLQSSNPNAFVFILQERMKDRSLYSGPVNGLLTKKTIQSIKLLCSTDLLAKKCDLGPLSREGARSVALLLS